MCSNFTDIPEAIRCSVNADGKTARIAGEKLNHYYQRCVHQMNRLLSTSS
jgi:hypothetical protein